MSELFLFEHGQAAAFPGDLPELERLLESIWQQRSQGHVADFWREPATSGQRFLDIDAQGQLRARNYVGFIRGPGFTIHLLPKLYQGAFPQGPRPEELERAYQDLLWWLGYTPFLRVPHYLSGLDQADADPLEILIGLFAELTRKVLSQSLFQAYETRSEDLSVVRGRLEMPEYIRHCLIPARWHRVRCAFDSFELDNLLNRVIKRVARLLLPWTRRAANRQKLTDILHLLDEVSDTYVQAQDCDRVQLNPMFEDYRPILDYCRLFLQNSVSYAYKPELKVFALLIPMERLFEQFLAGFLKAHQTRLPGLSKIEFQKSDLFLAEEVLSDGQKRPAFQMRHDLLLSYQSQGVLLDAKYKRLNPAQTYSGISQGDLYQMVAYAGRRGLRHCGLIYPRLAGQTQAISRRFEIPLAGWPEPIQIQVEQIPLTRNEPASDFRALESALLVCLNDFLSRSLAPSRASTLG